MAADIWTSISKQRLGVVATRALADPVFRSSARNPASTQQTIETDQTLAQELDLVGLGRLDEEEIAFCIGWAKLSVFACPTDAALITAIQNELTGPPAG